MLFETRAEKEFLYYAIEYFKKSLEQNQKSNDTLQKMYDIILEKESKYILIETDGYDIVTMVFCRYEDAYNKMVLKYNSYVPKEGLSEDSKADSYIDAYDAALYQNGENVYIFKIVKVLKKGRKKH